MISMKKVNELIDNAIVLSKNNDKEALASVQATKDTIHIIYGAKCDSDKNLGYLLSELSMIEHDIQKYLK